MSPPLTPHSPRRVVVIGAGAAGSMAAIFAATGGAETTLLERTRDGGRKILISGGGRCNVLPMRLDESRFVTDSSPNLLRKMLRSWPLREQIAFFEDELRLPLAEEAESSKLFPVSNKARDVRDGLLAYARRAGATLRMNTVVTGFAPLDGGWRVECDGAPPVDADAVIVATGGLSVPNTGSDGLGLRELARLGHAVNPVYAALTPIIAADSPFAELSGVSLRVTLSARDAVGETRRHGDAAAFSSRIRATAARRCSTCRTSPCVRAPSRRARRASRCNGRSLVPPSGKTALRPQGNRTVTGALRALLPDRLVGGSVDVGERGRRRVRSPSFGATSAFGSSRCWCRGALPWTGDEGYRKAEVTGGGVSLAEVDAHTMESRRHPGLYVCGEVLDAFGPVGGYNFFWAWATGRAAGLGAAATPPPA